MPNEHKIRVHIAPTVREYMAVYVSVSVSVSGSVSTRAYSCPD